MAFTIEQLQALEVAISQGVVTVKYGDKEITYRSLSEMQQLRRTMRLELDLIKATTHVYPSVSKGLNRGRRC